MDIRNIKNPIERLEAFKKHIYNNFTYTFPEYSIDEYDEIPWEDKEVKIWSEDWKEHINFIDSTITLDDINDDRIIALMQYLKITVQEAYDDIGEALYGSNCYEYGEQEYKILTYNEATDEEYECVKNTIKDCYLLDFYKDNKDNPAINYIDVEQWIDDWCNNRGQNIASYDGYEHEEIVNGKTYYIYRTN